MPKKPKQLFKVSFTLASESRVRALEISGKLQTIIDELDNRDKYNVRKNF